MDNLITIKGARLHNLKNITLSIPKNKLVIFTGLSGSGKSTLAIDTLHKEGQRQYLESLGMVDYAGKPDVDRIEGLSPSISIDQHLTNRSPRSTVGTATEVFTYLRVLFARIGHRPCPKCGADIPPSYDVSGDISWDDEGSDGEPEQAGFEDVQTYPCPNCGAPIPEMIMGNFSFNKPAGACPKCTGLGIVLQVNIHKLVDHEKSVVEGAIHGWDIHYIKRHTVTIRAAAKHYGFEFNLKTPVKDLGPVQRDYLFYGVDSPEFRRHYPGVKPPDAVHRGYFEGVVTNLMRRYAEHIHNAEYREKLAEFLYPETCPDCQGTRLRPEARQVIVAGQNIVAISQLPLNEISAWLDGLESVVTPEEWLF
ncbi:MAG: ABC-ATPase UvrA, partial [Chloroflexota bacterium]